MNSSCPSLTSFSTTLRVFLFCWRHHRWKKACMERQKDECGPYKERKAHTHKDK